MKNIIVIINHKISIDEICHNKFKIKFIVKLIENLHVTCYSSDYNFCITNKHRNYLHIIASES